MKESDFDMALSLFKNKIPVDAVIEFHPERSDVSITYKGRFFRTEYFFYELLIAFRDLIYIDRCLESWQRNWSKKYEKTIALCMSV